MQEKPPADLVRTTLGVLFLGGLILSAFWILRPFIGATIWATMLVVSTWPVMKWLEARLWRRRSLAVTAMTLLLGPLVTARLSTLPDIDYRETVRAAVEGFLHVYGRH